MAKNDGWEPINDGWEPINTPLDNAILTDTEELMQDGVAYTPQRGLLGQAWDVAKGIPKAGYEMGKEFATHPIDTTVDVAESIRAAVRRAPDSFTQMGAGIWQSMNEAAAYDPSQTDADGYNPTAGFYNREGVTLSDANKEQALKAAEVGSEATLAMKYDRLNDPRSTKSGKMVEGTLESVIQQAPGIVLSLAGMPSIGLPLMGAQTYGQKYAENRADGKNVADATENALFQSGVEVGTELLPFLQVAKFMKPGRLSTQVAKYMASEVPGELIATALQNSSDAYFDEKDPAKRMQQAYAYLQSHQFAQDEIDTFWQTIMQGAVMGAGGKIARGFAGEKDITPEQEREYETYQTAVKDAADYEKFYGKPAVKPEAPQWLKERQTIAENTSGEFAPQTTPAGINPLRSGRTEAINNIMEGETDETAAARLKAIEERKAGVTIPAAIVTSTDVQGAIEAFETEVESVSPTKTDRQSLLNALGGPEEITTPELSEYENLINSESGGIVTPAVTPESLTLGNLATAQAEPAPALYPQSSTAGGTATTSTNTVADLRREYLTKQLATATDPVKREEIQKKIESLPQVQPRVTEPSLETTDAITEGGATDEIQEMRGREEEVTEVTKVTTEGAAPVAPSTLSDEDKADIETILAKSPANIEYMDGERKAYGSEYLAKKLTPGVNKTADVPSVQSESGVVAAESVAASAPSNMSAKAKELGKTAGPNFQRGKATEAYTAKGTKIEGDYALVEYDDLIPSHSHEGKANPKYPQEMQPRDRSNGKSLEQIDEIARALRPSQLIGNSAKVASGSPFVGEDGVVESGNGRTIGIGRAYDIGTADEYRQYMKDHADEIGIDATKIDSMKKPVIVRIRKTETDRAEFAREANQSGKTAMAPAELAKADAARITPEHMALLNPDDSGNLLSAGNRSFTAKFLQMLGASEARGLTDASKNPTTQAAARMQSALFAAAYDDKRLIAMQSEEADVDIKNIIAGLTMAAPTFARLRARDGASKNLDIIPNIIEAIDAIRTAKANGTTLADHLDQQDIFKGKLDATSEAIVRKLDENKRSGKKIGEMLKDLATAAENEMDFQSQDSLFEARPKDKTEIIADVLSGATVPEKGTTVDNTPIYKKDSFLDAAATEGYATAKKTGKMPERMPEWVMQGDDELIMAFQVGARRYFDEKAQSPMAQKAKALGKEPVEEKAGLPTMDEFDAMFAEETAPVDHAAEAKKQALIAAKEAAKAVKGILKNATRGSLNMLPTVDDEVYKQIRPHLVSAWTAAKAAYGETKEAVKDFIKTMVDLIGVEVQPYAKLFYGEILDKTVEAQEIQAAAQGQMKEYLADVAAVAEITGHEILPNAEKTAVKSVEGIAKKLREGKTISDALRSTIISMNPVEDWKGIVAAMKAKGYQVWVSPKTQEEDISDLFSDAESAYKHVAIKFLTKGKGDPVVKELLVVSRNMFEAKQKLGHLLYDVTREIDGQVKRGVLAENMGIAEGTLEKYQKAIYGEVITANTDLKKLSDRFYNEAAAADDALKAEAASLTKATSSGDSAPRSAKPRALLKSNINFDAFSSEAKSILNDLSAPALASLSNAASKSESAAKALTKLLSYTGTSVSADAAGKLNLSSGETAVKEKEAPTNNSSDDPAAWWKGLSKDERAALLEAINSDAKPGAAWKFLPAQVKADLLAERDGNTVDTTNEKGIIEPTEGGEVNDVERSATNADDRNSPEGEGSEDVAGVQVEGETPDLPTGTATADGGVIQSGSGRQSDGSSQKKPRLRINDTRTNNDKRRGVARNTRNVPGVHGLDYRIPLGGLTREGSWKVTAGRNLDIIALVKKLDAEGRDATPAEQELLSKYTGFGASEIANKLFPGYVSYGEIRPNLADKDWRPLVDQLLSLELTPEELKLMVQSTQYAHYTSEGIVRSIYAAIEQRGFTGGTILEPGMGSGNFNGAMPDSIQAVSTYTGLELDPMTAKIAKYLYPNQNIMQGDYTKQRYPRDYFDLAIGNPPFAAITILTDPEYRKNKFSLHDYFFAKTIDRVRPGGLMVFITSRYTMDKMDDKARKYLTERADLVGAVRLPQTAFKQHSGTEVVTDVIFLRKRMKGEEAGGSAWASLAEVTTPEGLANINEYYTEHPEMILGTNSLQGTMYGPNQYTVLPAEGDIDTLFAKALENLPAHIYSPTGQSAEAIKEQTIERDFNPLIKKEGGIYLKDGNLMRVESGAGKSIDEIKKLNPKQKAWLADYVPLRDAVKQARLDQWNEADWEKSLKELNKIYREFVKKHGRLNAYTNVDRKATDADGNDIIISTRKITNRSLANMDTEGVLVMALEQITEEGDIKEAVFLKQRTVSKPDAAQISSVADALAVSLDQTGEFSLTHIAELMDMDRKEVIQGLGDLIYKQPNGQWELADAYLSGDVVMKLEEAQQAARMDDRFLRNVEALSKVQPKPLTSAEVSVKLGATWLSGAVIEEFGSEVLGIPLSVNLIPATGKWEVRNAAPQRRNDYYYGRRGAPKAAKPQALRGAGEWSTPSRGANEIIESILNNRAIKVTFTDKDGIHTDTVATAAATEKAAEMKKRFQSWVWEDGERTAILLDEYNRRFNNIAPRRFNGDHLTMPGVSLKYKLHPHVKRAIWRVIQTGDTYLAHAVGAGKTFEMIGAGMEMKRLGMIKKPLYVVPNHMLQQFTSEFQDLYPMAQIMVADEENFHKDNRKRFMAQAALNNPDAVVITHSSFGLLGMKPENVTIVRDEILSEMRERLAELMEEEGEKAPKTKQFAASIEAVEQRFDSIAISDKVDAALTFEELGADFLFVDEAHEFRKLDFTTNRPVKGIDPKGSRKALDLYVKTRWLQSRRPGRAIVFASGTPITNTLGELYTVQKFFNHAQMEKDGIHHFDAWAAMFGEVESGFEANAAGNYEVVERFSKFDNLPELGKRVREFMDVLTSDQLSAFVTRPEINGGQPEIVVAPNSPELKEYQDTVLQPRIVASKAFKRSRDVPNNPDPIIAIIADGRLAALDMRFINNSLPSDPNSKLNVFIDGIIETYKEGKDLTYIDKNTGKPEPLKGASQIVFYNNGFGEGAKNTRGFDARKWLMKRLQVAGIPASAVAWIDDYTTADSKEQMMKAVRSGAKRILIGSAKKMGTGMNVQNRLETLHYLDPPWYPSDVIQPDGRILRQGNQNKFVTMKRYATKGSYDTAQWGMVARKAKGIESFLNGDDSVRSIEDVSESNQFAMASALASGDQRYIQLAGLTADIDRLNMSYLGYSREQSELRRNQSFTESNIKFQKSQIALLKPAASAIGEHIREFVGKVDGEEYTNRQDFGQALLDKYTTVVDGWATKQPKQKGSKVLGSINGFDVGIDYYVTSLKNGDEETTHMISLVQMTTTVTDEVTVTNAKTPDMKVEFSDTGRGITDKIINGLNDVGNKLKTANQNLAEQTDELKVINKRLGNPFPHARELAEKIAEAQRLQNDLLGGTTAAEPLTSETDAETRFTPDMDKAPMSKEDRENRFSKGQPTENPNDAASLRVFFSQLLNWKAMEATGYFHIVESADNLPAEVKGKQGIRGVVLGNGHVYFVADQISHGEEKGILLHEIGVHYGLETMLGAKQFAEIKEQMDRLRKSGERSVSAAFKNVPEDTPAEYRAEEAIGYLAESNPEHSIIKKILAAVKIFLYRKGIISAKSLNTADLLAIVQASMDKVISEAGADVMPENWRLQMASRRFSLKRNPLVKNNSDLPAETREQAFWRVSQDRFNRVDELQKWLDKEGINLSERANAYRGLITMNGKIADQLKRFMEGEIEPLAQETAKAKITLDDVTDFLLMRHAEEANAQMRKVHDDPDATAFGVTDEEAQEALKEYKARPDYAELKKIAAKWQAFSGQTADMLLDAGIITEEQRTAWDGAYKNYVPVRGDNGKTGTGKGMKVNGKQIGRRGHDLRNEMVIENIVKARELAIKAIEKNNVNLSIVQMLHEADMEEIGTIGKPKRRPIMANTTYYEIKIDGLLEAAFNTRDKAERYISHNKLKNAKINETKEVTIAAMVSVNLADNEINAYLEGHEVRITLNDEILARVLTNKDAEQLGRVFQMGKDINSYFSRIYTGYDPRFTIRNTIRDATAGVVNLAGDYGAATAAKIAVNYPKAVRELLRARKDPSKSSWVDRYRKHGGSTGATYLPSLERIGEDINSIYREQLGAVEAYKSIFAEEKESGASNMKAHMKATLKSGVAKFKGIPVLGHGLKLIEGMNAISENAFRLATFITLIEQGKSAGEAGEAAKNSTINFDKRGEWGASLSALYLFYNPAIQGIHRSFEALVRSKHKEQAQALVGSMAILGWLVAEFARSMDGDDDEEWMKVSRSTKNRNLVIRTGEKSFITIPLSYEYGSFVGLGYAMSDAMHGEFTKKSALNLASSIMDGMSPLGNPVTEEGLTAKSAFAMAPTMVKLLGAPAANIGSFGTPIAPTKYQQSKPDSQNLYRATKGTVYDKTAQALNESTGGTKYSAGVIDVSPEMLKFYTRSLLGGAYTFVDQVVQLGVIGANGATPDIGEIPMLNVLARENTVRDTRREFWEIANDAKKATDEWKAAKKDKNFEVATDLKEQNAELIAVGKIAEHQKKLVTAKRNAIDAIRLDDTLSFTEKREKTKALEIEEEAIYERLIKKFGAQ